MCLWRIASAVGEDGELKVRGLNAGARHASTPEIKCSMGALYPRLSHDYESYLKLAVARIILAITKNA